MQSLVEEITHKQRIIFLGTNAKELIEISSKVLSRINKKHDVIFEDSETISDAPLVLIENQADRYEHHILIIGKPNDRMLSQLQNLADRTPKAGSIIYNKKANEVAAICNRKRKDVVQIPYRASKKNDDEQFQLIKALFSRLRVPEGEFSKLLDLS